MLVCSKLVLLRILITDLPFICKSIGQPVIIESHLLLQQITSTECQACFLCLLFVLPGRIPKPTGCRKEFGQSSFFAKQYFFHTFPYFFHTFGVFLCDRAQGVERFATHPITSLVKYPPPRGVMRQLSLF